MNRIAQRVTLTLALTIALLTALLISSQAQAAPAGQGSAGLSAADAAALLTLHNDWRSRYSVPLLVWDDTVAATAQDWANQIAASGNFAHRPNNKYGENIWAGTTGFFGPPSVVNSWGSEVSDYDFATNTCAAGKVCGHFTQLVWANTARVGCGKATANGNDFYVCNYDPPGNVVGQAPGASPATSTPLATAPADAQATDTPAPTVPTANTAPTNTEPGTALPFDTPNLTIPPSGLLWYTVPNPDVNAQVTIRIPGAGDNGMFFIVFAPSQVADLANSTHLGFAGPEGDDLVWHGQSFEAGPYFVLVNNNTTEPITFTITTQ